MSIDGRVLFKANVAASETYNTALEQHLRDALGVRFAERPGTDPAKRPIREIVGVDPALNQRWSSRRMLIKGRQGELATQFQRDHGRPPTPVEALDLAQQATLETRDAKHEPRSLTEQRTTWHAQAAETLGGPEAVQAMISKAVNPISITRPELNAEWVAATADKVLAAVEEHRSTWQSWHVRAEVLRQIRAAEIELHRFTDTAEAAATLALRDGRPEALGFYLDRRRVDIGDPTTTLDAVFEAWQTDRSHGLDAIMLAPTRELVSRLNQRAQDHRLAAAAPGRQVELTDGNRASVGDLIITRRNDRRLRTSATDWVKTATAGSFST